MSIEDILKGIIFGNGSQAQNAVIENQQKVNQEQENLSVIDTERESSSQEKATLDSEASDAQSELSITREAVTTAQTNLSNAQTALSEAMSIPVKEIENEDGTITYDSSERDSAIAQAQAELNAAQEALEKATSENEHAQEQLDSLQEQIESIQTALDEIAAKKTDAQSSLETAQRELEAAKEEAERIEQENQEQQEESNNEQDLNSGLLENFSNSITLIKNFLGLTKEMTEDEKTDITKNAQILLDSDSYSEEEIENAKNEISKITRSRNNYVNDEETQRYINLAQSVSNLNGEQTEDEKNSIRDEVIDILKEKNIENGSTERTANAVAQAYKEIGIAEDGDNTGEPLKYGGRSGDAWCASFVSWLYGDGQNSDNSDTFDYQIAVRYLKQDAANAGYYSEVGTYEPSAGDIMIQTSNGASHTGLVIKTDDEYVYTIEGNANDAVRARKYKKDGEQYQKISGYIRMNEWTGGEASHTSYDYLSDSQYIDMDEENEDKTV
ncbi:MAG: CHAP domain-containing protein [Candidatus Gastranaerophilales bacterium]|nr:CHAP domain-containing protein [Candidatus Gastranaerophilales bacterium]